jgi:hypothetical protein
MFAFFGVTFAQTWYNCASFWKVKPGDAYTINDQCATLPGYPMMVGGTNITVAYTQEWIKSSTSDINAAGPILSYSLSESIDIYGTFAKLPSDLVVILTTDNNWPYSAATWYPIDKTPPCQIETWARWTDNTNNDKPRALQVLAHEFYHCIQQLTIGRSGGWIIEGSASYFSNLVFPYVNAEWPGPEYNYNPSLPIYGQVKRDAYTTELFFQSLESSRGFLYIHQWVMDNAPRIVETAAQQITRLSQITGFTDDFYTFAKQFSLKQILDTSGTYIPGLVDIPPVPATLSITAGGLTGTTTLKTTPFTISVFSIDLAAGQTAALYSNGNDHQRVAYRQSTDTYWSEMPSGPGVGDEGYTVLTCNGGSDPITILILFVSTADVASDTVQITVNQVNTDPSCGCPLPPSGVQKRGLEKRGLTGCASSSSSPPPPSQGGNGTCSSSSIVTDPCMNGKTWNLDLPSMEKLLNDKFATQGATINSITLSGSGQLTIDGNKAAASYSNFAVNIDLTIEGIEVPTSTTLNGNFDAYLYTLSGGNGSGDFCLSVYDGEGTAVETDPITGGFSFNLTPEGGFIDEHYDIKYTCSAGSLTIEGFLNGASEFGPYVYNS